VSSSTTTDAAPRRPSVAGFEIESELGRGPRGTVYIATQTGLGRRVALKLYPASGAPGRRDGLTAAWPEHPGVARLHAAGTAGEGSFTASGLAVGGSLAARLAARDIAREPALALCDQAAATLAAVGVAHGALGAGNVLIDADGRALLCDFGMPGVQASAEADRRALAQLRADCARLPARVAGRRRGGILAGVVAVAVVAAVAVVVLASGGDGDRRQAVVPAPLPGATVLGSTLTGAPAATLGCDGAAPNGSQPACSIMPLRRDGRSLAFPADGVIRRWAVRGASGSVTLQVARPAGAGRFVARAVAQTERVAGPAPRAFATDLPVRRGDLAAIALAPGAGIGVAPRAAAAGDAASRFVGALNYKPPRTPVGATGTGLDRGVELRVEYLPGGRPRPVPTLTGAAARAAAAGRVLAEGEDEFSGVRVRTLRVVALPGAIALDLLRGSTRLQRVTVVGADPRGRLTALVRESFLAPGAGVVWRNPDGRVIRHHYRAGPSRLTVID